MYSLAGFCDAVKDRKAMAEAHGIRLSRVLICPIWELKMMTAIMHATPMPDGSYRLDPFRCSKHKPATQLLCVLYGVPVIPDNRIKNDMWFMYERK